MTAQGNQNFFADARNIVISGGTFTSVKSPSATRNVNGLQLLLQNISEGAVYNAAERGDPPRCHPHTRIAIRAEIMEWIEAPPAMRKLILWMYGPAGSGKTAIAQSIAEECARRGRLAASFFFWRTAAGRNNAFQFIATIAYQLSRNIPRMEEHLLTAIERNPTIFFLSLSTQMRVLVIDPLKLVAPSLSTAMFAIVDGVDECGPDGQSQAELLHLLASLASELQHLPLIFLIASRPEYEIRETFNGNLLNPLTKVLVLDNSYKPDEDIKLYFDSTFGGIYEKHRRLGSRLPSPWPAVGDVHSLVSKASGQFIFAATVTKYISSSRHNPVERMNIILRLSTSGNETPFALLDALYRFILDSIDITIIEKVLDILALILLDKSRTLNLNMAEELLHINLRRTLVDMHSLLDVPPPSDTDAQLPKVYHASLEDFLMDKSRSCQYYIGGGEGHLRLSRYCFKAMGRFSHFEILTLRNVVMCFGNHATMSPANEDLANDLAHFDLRAVMEGISDFKDDLFNIDWKEFFKGAKKLVGLDRLDIVLRLQHEFDMFLLDRIAQYPPSLRTHIPVLMFLHICFDLPCDFKLFHILLLGASNSAEQHTEFLNLDKRLLSLADDDEFSSKSDSNERIDSHERIIMWESWFRDKSRAGKCLVDDESFAALAKAIVSVIYPKPGERNQTIDDTNLCGNEMYDILENASTDWDLANFLRERAVQYRDDVEPIPERQIIAEASVGYIQRCGISFLEHSHQPDMNRCAICDLSPPSIENIEDSSSDSESEAHNASDGLSIGREGIVTPIPSASRLPPISEWYDSESTATTSTLSSTSHAPSRLELEAQESATVPSAPAQHEALTTQNSSSSILLSISEWYQHIDTVPAPQSQRKRVDGLAVPTAAYLFEGFEKGKRRKA